METIDTSDVSMMENGMPANSSPPVEAPRTTRRNRFNLLGVFGIAALALIIGLSVGLTRNKGTSPPAAADADSSSGAGTTMSTPATDKQERTENPTTLYKDSSGSMGVTLKLFSPDMTKTYLNDDELKADLTEVAKFIVVNIIKTNVAEMKMFETYYSGFDWMDWNNTYGNDTTFWNEDETTLWNQTTEETPTTANDAITADDPGNQGMTTSTSTVSNHGTGAEVPNPTSAKEKSAFRSNNQEGGIEEADVVQSDGKYVYAAYGDILVVWDAVSGKIVTNITMPEIDIGNYSAGHFPVYGHHDHDGTVLDSNVTGNQSHFDEDELSFPASSPHIYSYYDHDDDFLYSNVTGNQSHFDEDNHSFPASSPQIYGYYDHNGDFLYSNVTGNQSHLDDDGLFPASSSLPVFNITGIFTDMYNYMYKPKPQILALLLSEDRLVVVIKGYGETTRAQMNGNGTSSIIYELKDTLVQVYSTSGIANGDLVLLKETHVNGYFKDARMIGSNVHLVTAATIDTYASLASPLYCWQSDFASLSPEEYEVAATKFAEEKLITNFVDKLVKEISINGKIDLAQVGLWQTELSNNTSIEQAIYGHTGVMSTLMQVVSFDVMDNSSDDLQLSLAGAFMPSMGFTYATDDMLVVAAYGWNWNSVLSGSIETTYLLGFSLTGASSTPHAVGSVNGYLMNQYSLDIVDGYMRVATTIQSYWPYYYFTEDANENATNFNASIPEFLTKNYITVLEIPAASNPGELKKVGQTDSLGENGQLLSSVRFFDTGAYLSMAEFGYFPTNNTAFKTSLLVMDLTNPADPKVAGSLEIPGISSYLYPLNVANNLMLAVGQDSDVNTGVSFSGLSLTVFDASDPANSLILQRHVVQPVDDSAYAYSDATWDFDAFRYLSLPNDAGIVIVPLNIQADWISTAFDSGGNFDGFVVFDVSKNGISERTRISHVNSEDFWGCYYNANLPARSLVIQGDLMTMKGHSVVSTNLDSSKVTWNMTLPNPQDDSSDCVNWMVL